MHHILMLQQRNLPSAKCLFTPQNNRSGGIANLCKAHLACEVSVALVTFEDVVLIAGVLGKRKICVSVLL